MRRSANQIGVAIFELRYLAWEPLGFLAPERRVEVLLVLWELV